MAGLFALFAMAGLALGFGARFLAFAPFRGNPWLTVALPVLLFLKPALLEDAVFRGALVPHPRERLPGSKVGWIAASSLIAFVAWHPAQALLYRHSEIGLFTSLIFLTLTFALGLVCTAAYLVSGSLWPPVVMHWVSVTVWIEFLGGAARLGIGAR
jgi:predicted Abi (CAAX) family protease